MKYADARATIKTGDTLAWSHRRLKSWYDFKVMVVRFAQASEYCHVGTAIVLGGRVWALEAVIPHVRLVPLSNLLPCYILDDEPLTDAQVEEGLALVGKEDVVYSQVEAIKAFFGANNNSDNLIECAELTNIVHHRNWPATPSKVVGRLLEYGATLREVQP